jgi:hypothetical protein
MSEAKNANIPQMNVGRLVEVLAAAYAGLLRSGAPLRLFPSVMLWGPPGIGKSQAVRQLGAVLGRETGRRVHITDVRLLLFNPIDLRGIPTANADRTLAVWLRPQIFQMDPSEDVVNILFLDEISAAPQSVQAAAYQITLDRVVGEHKLPENCIVLAAGNRVTDKSVAFKMPKALANRLLHIEVEGSFKSWKEWAIRRGINEKIVGFLSFRPNFLMGFDPATDDLAFPTPRSWEMAGSLLDLSGGSVNECFSLLCGLVGTAAAMELRTWEAVWRELPNVEDIFNGKTPPVPTKPDALYALISAMTAYAHEHQDDLMRIGNSVAYALRLPPDFSMVLMQDYMCIAPGYREQLLTIPDFSRWLSTKGSMLNGRTG